LEVQGFKTAVQEGTGSGKTQKNDLNGKMIVRENCSGEGAGREKTLLRTKGGEVKKKKGGGEMGKRSLK